MDTKPEPAGCRTAGNPRSPWRRVFWSFRRFRIATPTSSCRPTSRGDAQRFDNTPTDNPITDAGATLGRVLFYDTRLSANDTVSCSSCHVQKPAFADPKPVQPWVCGRHDRPPRDESGEPAVSPARPVLLGRARRQPGVDGPDAGGEPAGDGQDLERLPAILARDERYQALFRSALATRRSPTSASRERWRSSSARWCRISRNTTRGARLQDRRRTTSPNFTPQENRGKALFCVTVRCATCPIRTRTSS